MKMSIIAGALGLAVLGTAASAQSVDQRHELQQQRIDHGVENGQLTPHEAHKLEKQQNRIDRTERRDRERNGGALNPRQREHLQQREDRASAKIYRQKHDRQTSY